MGPWLVQMGWPEVYVLDGGLAGRELVPGRRAPVVPELDKADVPMIEAAELRRLLDSGEAAVVDLAPSIAYEAGHIPGAWFAVRARLPASLEKLPPRPVLVLTSPDGALAQTGGGRTPGKAGFRRCMRWMAAPRRGAKPGCRSRPGARRWPTHPTIAGAVPMILTLREGARERYLKWEIELVHQIEREGDVGFRVPELAA